jgi:uncharacterized protein (TIGR03437 family)
MVVVGEIEVTLMNASTTLMVLCATFLPGAFGQGAITGLGYHYQSTTVAPGQLISVFVAGSVTGDVSVSQSGRPVPVLGMSSSASCLNLNACSPMTAITIQIPYEIEPYCVFTNPQCEVRELAQLTLSVNGIAETPINLNPVADQIHILTACDTVVPGGTESPAQYSGLPCEPLVAHADGSLVTAASPAQTGEEVVAYAAGLGITVPAVGTGEAATTATPTYETFLLDFNFRPNALATEPLQPTTPGLPPAGSNVPLYSGLVPGEVGLYQINFTVPTPPASIQPCSGAVQSNLTVSVGGLASFDGAGICVAE